MVMKIKKTKKSVRQRGETTHGHGARKKWKGSGHRGGIGMSGSGKRGDQKTTFIQKKYGNKYFGKQGITSRGTKKKREKTINLRDIQKKFGKEKELVLKDYKILGDGELKEKLIIKAKAFTKTAEEKIKKAGGEALLIRVPREKIENKEKPKEEKKGKKEKLDKSKEKSKKTPEKVQKKKAE